MVSNILVVDDSQVDLDRMNHLLKDAGYHTYLAINGKKAIEMAKTHMPDLILMDVNMPEMDGFAATRALSNDPETAGIPVVLVTAKDQKADKAWGKMLGAKGYITKPFNDNEILSVIETI